MALNRGLGGFGVKPAEVLIYAVDDNYSLGLVPTSVIPVAEGTTTLTNAIFTAGNNTVAISTNSLTGQQLYAYNISSASLQELPYHAGGNLRLENDGRIYASVAGTSTILAINTNLTTGFNLTLSDTSILTGHLAQPVFKVIPAGDINHALYARSAPTLARVCNSYPLTNPSL